MNTQIKNLLGVALVIAVLAIGSAAWSAARSYDQALDPASIRSFSVSAEGEVTAIPDIAEFTFGVTTESDTDSLKDAQARNAETTNSVISFLKSNGVENEDVKTTNFQISPQYERVACIFRSGETCPPPKIVGYTISQNLRVKVRDFEETGTLLGGVVERGANNVSGLTFTIDDEEALQKEARDKAIKNAQKKAKELARAAGVSVGRLLAIQEGSTPRPVFFESAMKVSLDSIGGAAPSIEAGTQEITARVTLTYEIR